MSALPPAPALLLAACLAPPGEPVDTWRRWWETGHPDTDGDSDPNRDSDDGTICAALEGEPDGLVPSWTGTCDTDLGYVPYEGHCYYNVESYTTWVVARASCRAGGGYLTTMQDAGENAFVHTLNIRPYKGGCDGDTEGTWTWITGEPWAYTNWNHGEPNNLGDEDCLDSYGDGLWNDMDCESVGLQYICEFE